MEPENQATPNELDQQVIEQISNTLGALNDGGVPAQVAPMPAQAPAPQPSVAPTPAVEESVQQEFTTAPTSQETLRTMFTDKPVQPVEVAPIDQVPPDTPIPEPEHMDDRARNAWVESRNREKQLRQLLAQQKKQIEELASQQSKFQTEHDELAKALKDKDDELRVANDSLGKLDLSGSVEFRQRYDEPVLQAKENLDTEIHDAIQGADTPEQIAKIREYILGDDRQFQTYISRLDIDTQGRLIEKRRTLKELSAQREQAIEDWQNTSKGLSDTAARTNAAERALTRQRYAEDAIKFNTSTMPVNLRPYVTTDEAFTDDVRSANEAFTAFMQTATEEDLARAAHLGHFVPSLNRALMMALQEARELQNELYQLRGIRNVRARTSSIQTPVPKPVVKAVTPEGLSEQVEAGIADTLAPLMGGPAMAR